MNILAIDTSNQVMGVAIYKDGQVLAEYTTNMKRNHSIGLMPAIDHIMKETDMKPDQLDRIAVAKGPGSYTGVRIGLSTAKTMAWTLNIPIVALSSLELVAYNGFGFAKYICPFFDARRGLVYTGLYEQTDSHLAVRKEEQNISFEAWLGQLNEMEESILFLSQDVELHRSMIVSILGEKAVFPSVDQFHLPKAGILASLAADRDHELTHEITPNYLRLVEAEANWLKEQERKRNE
ncbi:tRNA (adenosine(37)-N6)-threonylcarbamoyltransferase complex dimerization subunit type 1 TsaB [Gracilibacillus oryzae]|uniref:tRNA (Adenosine(37)-N6)-threonylcarbamoyltransferase complex dimerization subunit type 1 TsaB n=1 Tax=Gracilibacillus oryzae TaxID=1672701 RepID=A0A7C8GQ91_9BACI|nr:tRNA (adenosine(37)-N6)-threonylcarbamoyltransferase complex dimerization subunit type 1 TsaB [Gracilibacillus oryzae]KAB8125693.1 tRNA (adenosine(37)-N6)-threonylcarbamoyltransferase complex dimerization subunit type 1 TsaB [Gracilibacillus oryzae]